MIRIIKNLLGLSSGNKGKKRVRKNRVMGRLQVSCLRETVTHQMRLARPRPGEAKVQLGI